MPFPGQALPFCEPYDRARGVQTFRTAARGTGPRPVLPKAT